MSVCLLNDVLKDYPECKTYVVKNPFWIWLVQFLSWDYPEIGDMRLGLWCGRKGLLAKEKEHSDNQL